MSTNQECVASAARERQKMKWWRAAAVCILLLLCAIEYVNYLYSRCWERGSYLRWLSFRTQSLADLGARIRAYGKAHDGTLPGSWDEFTEAGVVADGEINFPDAFQNVQVTRTLRPIATLDMGDTLILVVESYGFESGECQVLHLSGLAEIDNMPLAITRDNELRKELGVPELPMPSRP